MTYSSAGKENTFSNSTKFESFKVSPFYTRFYLNYLRAKYDLTHFG